MRRIPGAASAAAHPALMEHAAKIPPLYFDRKDRDLIRIVNESLDTTRASRKRYFPYFHPNGIKELAESKGLRTAYAVAYLLSSLEVGGVEDRLRALRMLRMEVIDAAEGPLPKNTARVLLEIMKHLVRARGDERRQLELAHDFRLAASGKPRFIRRMLRRYHLLEMPEAWNQIAFDDHVHDVNTKGRKSSSHLIMDAWIKGIRRLRVIHYYYLEPRFAAELFEAARILEIDVRIGIEYYARFRGRYVQLIWVPRGFADSQAFLCFLEEPAVSHLMEAGRRAARWQQRSVMELLGKFNAVHRRAIEQRLGVELAPIAESEFLAFVGIGQKSKLHLSKFIEDRLVLALERRVAELRREFPAASAERRAEIERWVAEVNRLDLEAFVDGFLEPERNPEIRYPEQPSTDPDTPELLRLGPREILARLAALHSGYRITLNLTHLTAADVLELLYDCQGMITRLELFNLKDYTAGKTEHIGDIGRLMLAVNEGSVIHLKQVIREIIAGLSAADDPRSAAQAEKLRVILYDIESFTSYYAGRALKARIGSDSTGRSPRLPGMGIAVLETLPARARREVRRQDPAQSRMLLPVQMTVYKTVIHLPREAALSASREFNGFSGEPSWNPFGRNRVVRWQVETTQTRLAEPGNLVTLGGFRRSIDNGLRLEAREAAPRPALPPLSCLNSRLKNALKVLCGFLPAFATFFFTQPWWLLAYGGAVIWFAITGLRNILQSVLGGGGLRRSPLLNWSDYVSWSRLTDSLFFTGFSVPLLDFLVKTVLLDRGLGINTGNQPAVLYAVMALVNGAYLSSHNVLRGLPREAVVGNFFRSVLSIPLAFAVNAAAGAVLASAGVASPAAELQKWAAIISKASSDTVAGFIEGIADRRRNILLRLRDLRVKFGQLFETYAQLELIHPEVEVFTVLQETPAAERRSAGEARDLERIIMIHALDLLYFWMVQPRGRDALERFLQTLTEDERLIFASSQFTLQRCREISQLFLDGILGENFPKPLSFYLARYGEYLEAVKRLAFAETSSLTAPPPRRYTVRPPVLKCPIAPGNREADVP